MKSLVSNIREFFNRRTKNSFFDKKATLQQRTLVIENGESAKRLLSNNDFALLFNLYRFDLLSKLEDSRNDLERITNSQYVAGVRDFVSFVEQQEIFGKMALKNAETDEKKG